MEINPSEATILGVSSSEIRINWATEPLGENLSHLCGGRNRHKEVEVEDKVDDTFRPFTAAELLGDISIG